MIQVRTYTAQRGEVSFLFGTRALSIAAKNMGAESISKFAAKFSEPSFADIAQLLFAGHENACFYMKKDLVYQNTDEIYEFIDDIGMGEMTALMTAAMQDMSGNSGGKKKEVETSG
jgi:hypothetical protein